MRPQNSSGSEPSVGEGERRVRDDYSFWPEPVVEQNCVLLKLARLWKWRFRKKDGEANLIYYIVVAYVPNPVYFSIK